MSQNPPPWGQQGAGQPPQGYGYPQGAPGQGNYPYGGYPAQGIPPQQGYPQAYGQQPGYPAQGPPQGYGRPPGRPRKSNATIIGIVVAAVVLLTAIGGIFIALNRGGDEPVTTITPGTPSQPTEDPTEQPTEDPTEQPTDAPTTQEPSEDPTQAPTGEPSPGGDSIDLGSGITLTPAAGWEVRKKSTSSAQLSNGTEIFLGQAVEVDRGSNAGQLCTAWHKSIAEGTSGGKFQEPKSVDVDNPELKAATCAAQTTVSSGQGSTTIILVSIVSVRSSDGVTVIGTAYFTAQTDTQQLDTDYSAMVNSMLRSQSR